MKHPLIILLTIVICSAANGQAGKFYYNKHWELTTKDSAVFIRTCEFDTATQVFTGVVTDEYSSGNPQMTGNYTPNKKEGDFTFFYANGQIESTGKFSRNQRSGLWKYYYPNGNQKMHVEYGNNSKKIISLTDSIGNLLITDGTGRWTETYEMYRVPEKIIVTGGFKNYQKHGKWECKLAPRRKMYNETYKNGEFDGGAIFTDGRVVRNNVPHDNVLELPYKFQITENFVIAKDVDFRTYPFLLRYSYNEL